MNSQDRKSKPLCLIGMPGSGKSTIGELLSKRLGLAFVDTDILIQEQESATLAEIIAAKGNQALLDIEQQVLLEMPIRPSVISTGGSVVYSAAVMSRLVAESTLIYLQARLETVAHRISLAPDRGIAAPGNQTLEDIYSERIPLYEKYAHFTVEVDEDLPEQIVSHVVNSIDCNPD